MKNSKTSRSKLITGAISLALLGGVTFLSSPTAFADFRLTVTLDAQHASLKAPATSHATGDIIERDENYYLCKRGGCGGFADDQEPDAHTFLKLAEENKVVLSEDKTQLIITTSLANTTGSYPASTVCKLKNGEYVLGIFDFCYIDTEVTAEFNQYASLNLSGLGTITIDSE
jgi:hypothetical protein